LKDTCNLLFSIENLIYFDSYVEEDSGVGVGSELSTGELVGVGEADPGLTPGLSNE
jgi:hypothetical protein